MNNYTDKLIESYLQEDAKNQNDIGYSAVGKTMQASPEFASFYEYAVNYSFKYTTFSHLVFSAPDNAKPWADMDAADIAAYLLNHEHTVGKSTRAMMPTSDDFIDAKVKGNFDDLVMEAAQYCINRMLYIVLLDKWAEKYADVDIAGFKLTKRSKNISTVYSYEFGCMTNIHINQGTWTFAGGNNYFMGKVMLDIPAYTVLSKISTKYLMSDQAIECSIIIDAINYLNPRAALSQDIVDAIKNGFSVNTTITLKSLAGTIKTELLKMEDSISMYNMPIYHITTPDTMPSCEVVAASKADALYIFEDIIKSLEQEVAVDPKALIELIRENGQHLNASINSLLQASLKPALADVKADKWIKQADGNYRIDAPDANAVLSYKP